jgi:hypothetical protein
MDALKLADNARAGRHPFQPINVIWIPSCQSALQFKKTLNFYPSCRTLSGIQKRKKLKKRWIPGLARNDQKMNMQNSDTCDTRCFAEKTKAREKRERNY